MRYKIQDLEGTRKKRVQSEERETNNKGGKDFHWTVGERLDECCSTIGAQTREISERSVYICSGRFGHLSPLHTILHCKTNTSLQMTVNWSELLGQAEFVLGVTHLQVHCTQWRQETTSITNYFAEIIFVLNSVLCAFISISCSMSQMWDNFLSVFWKRKEF